MQRILLLRRGGLGDTLLMLPVVRALRRCWPGELHFFGVHEFTDLLRRFGAVDAAASSETLQAWSLGRAGARAAAAAVARLRAFSLVVADDPAMAAANGPATRVLVFDPRPRAVDRPLAQQVLAQLGLAGPLDEPLAPRPRVVGSEVVLAPGSGGRAKCWPREHWSELAARLRADGRDLAVVVGPTEVERDDPRRWPWPAGTAFLAQLPLADLAARLQRARAFLGNDSGVTHLAAALAVPTIALFGPSEPRVWAPPFPWVTAIASRTDGPPAVLVPEVHAALRRTLPD